MLTITNVKKTFNKGTVNEKKALNGINLHLAPGDFVTIIGGNGAGKSTMLNMIAGVYPIDSGKIEIDGVNISREPEYKRAKYIGRVFQDPMRGTAPGMTIEENLALAAGHGGWLSRVSKGDKKLFRDKLALLEMGLEDRMSQPVGLLSGGQRQALLLDEHTAALDPATAEKVLTLTKSIVSENNLTCLMITHNMQSALELGNRTIMMHGGNIIFDAEGEERSKLTVQDLLGKFKENAGKELDNDRMLLV